MISVENICKSFGDRQILKNISTVFEQGKTNLIIGESGSGKTVLLKSIVGLHQIDSGKILYDGVRFDNLNKEERKTIYEKVGMLFQGSALFDFATVEENVMFPLNFFTNMTMDEKRERANFCLKRVNISTPKLYPNEISGGMQKRVAIARAIALNPKYLLCDEPNSGLDPKTSTVIDGLIKEITDEYQMTTIINTHDMNSVLDIGQKIIFIYKGEKCWEGTNQEITHTDNEKLNDFVFATGLARLMKK